MAKVKRAPVRAKVKLADTWNLGALFKSDDAWHHAFKKLEGQIDGFEQFRGQLGKSPKVLRQCYEFEIEFGNCF